MAHRAFELGDNLKQGNNDEKAELHNALLQDAGMTNIERVADKTAKAAPQEGEKLSAAQTQFATAMKEYEGAQGDKAAALVKLGPKFEDAIKTADADFDTTMAKIGPEAKKLQPAYEAATAKVEEQQAKLQETFGKVPENDQDRVAALVEAYAKLGKGDDAIRTAIENGLAKYPGLIPAVKDLNAANNAPAIKQMAALEQQAGKAMQDRIFLRAGYAELLSQNGFEDKAEQYIRESAEIMGFPVPQRKPAINPGEKYI